MDKRKGYVLLLINAGVSNSVSERKKSRCNSHKIKIHVYFHSEHFEFRHFRPHYLDVDTIFGD
jgi:hypothetical protein